MERKFRLHEAAREGRIEEACEPLDIGADVNARDHDGETPLSLAAHEGHIEMVKLLLDRGADVKAAEDHGWTPLHLAAGALFIERGLSGSE